MRSQASARSAARNNLVAAADVFFIAYAKRQCLRRAALPRVVPPSHQGSSPPNGCRAFPAGCRHVVGHTSEDHSDDRVDGAENAFVGKPTSLMTRLPVPEGATSRRVSSADRDGVAAIGYPLTLREWASRR